MDKKMKEFLEFLQSDASVPDSISEKVWQTVKKDLHPSSLLIFVKLLLIHLVVGTATLFVCPQFGNGAWLWKGHGLMGIFMKWGTVGCALGCGATFLGFSLLIGGFLLKASELKKLRSTVGIQVFLLSALSLMLLMLLGTDSGWEFASLWLVGAFLGGLASGLLGGSLKGEFKNFAKY